MIYENSVEFGLAEVVEVYDKTYKWIPADASSKLDRSTTDDLFSISVRSYNEEEQQPFVARPANPNVKQIPLIGEHVLVFRSINQESTTDKKRGQWYYFPAISLQSGINNNSLPGVARNRGNDVNEIPQGIADKDLGEEFDEQVISPLQPFEGDVLIEGRFGNSIRLGSTGKNDSERYTKERNYSGTNSTDPIIILSNGQLNKKNKEFVVESFEDDQASLYLTSTQQISDNGIQLDFNKHTAVSEFNTSQLIGSADRIILNSKSDSVILNSSNRISLIATEGVRIGSDNASEPMILGDKLESVLIKILDIIQAGGINSAGKTTPIRIADIQTLRTTINEIRSNKHFLDT